MRRHHRCCVRSVFAIVLACACAVASVAAAGGAGKPAEWPGVRIHHPIRRLAVETSLSEAKRWLSRDECRSVLSEFRDRSGHPLEDRLIALGVDAPDYLRLIQFVEGDGEPQLPLSHDRVHRARQPCRVRVRPEFRIPLAERQDPQQRDRDPRSASQPWPRREPSHERGDHASRDRPLRQGLTRRPALSCPGDLRVAETGQCGARPR